MNDISTLTIVGALDTNPSRFEIKFNPVKLGQSCEIAIASLFQGEILNVHSANNKVYFYFKEDVSINWDELERIEKESNLMHNKSDVLKNVIGDAPRMVVLPPGNYASAASISWVISNLIRDELGVLRKRDAMATSVDKQHGVINIGIESLYFVIEGKDDTPWDLLNVFENQFKSFTVEDIDFSCSVTPAFIYANIVENSYINSKLSRNLGVVPIKNTSRWSFYEPSYPKFVAINIKEFSSILIEIRDIKSEFVRFNPNFKTVLTLVVRPIKGRSSGE